MATFLLGAVSIAYCPQIFAEDEGADPPQVQNDKGQGKKPVDVRPDLFQDVHAARTKVTTNTDEAIKELRGLVAEIFEELGRSQMLFGSCMHGLLRAYTIKGDLEKAEEAAKELEKYLELKKDDFGKATWEAYFLLALHRHHNGEFGEGFPWIKGWIERYQQDLLSVLTASSEYKYMAHLDAWMSPYTLLHYVRDWRVLADAALRTKGVVVDTMLEDQKVVHIAKNGGGAGLLEDLGKLRSVYRNNLVEGAEMADLDDEAGELEKKLARLGVSQLPLRHTLTASYQDVQRRLPSDSALVEYVVFREYRNPVESVMRYGVVITQKTGYPRWIQMGMKGNTDPVIHDVRLMMEEGKDPKEAERKAGLLYNWLWGHNVKRVLPSTIKKVFIAPAGEINVVPFAALISPEKKFLCEEVEIYYVAAGRDLLRSPETTESKNSAKVAFFGDPTFSEKGKDGRFSRLPNARTEGKAIKELLPALKLDGDFYLGKDATEDRLRSMQAPKILHLSTQSFFSEPFPENRGLSNPILRGGVALAGASDTMMRHREDIRLAKPDDGILLAGEVATLNLKGTDLVFLSASEVTERRVPNGSGIFALRRGFSMAGARHILISLWPAADGQNNEFIKDFYSEYAGGEYPPKALGLVQRKWLTRLKKEEGIVQAMRLAGSFVMTSYGVPGE